MTVEVNTGTDTETDTGTDTGIAADADLASASDSAATVEMDVETADADPGVDAAADPDAASVAVTETAADAETDAATGVDTDDAARASGPAAEAGEEAGGAMPLQLTCPKCGADDLVMDAGSRFCEGCGYGVDEPVTGEEEPPATVGPKPCANCGGTDFDYEGYCQGCGDLQPRRRDRMEVDLRVVAGISDRGLRHHRNEDSMALMPAVTPGGRTVVVAVVCDGVSTSERPDEASAAAVSTAARVLLTAFQSGRTDADELTVQAVRAADGAVARLARDSDHGNPPACTYVSAVVGADTGVTVGWLGDSRAYWLDANGSSRQLTADDAEEGSHAIEAWLGADSGSPEPHTASFQPPGPGVVLVCSDGLWNYVDQAAELAELALPEALTEPKAAAVRLVRRALDDGGHDNITAVLVPYPVPASAEPSA